MRAKSIALFPYWLACQNCPPYFPLDRFEKEQNKSTIAQSPDTDRIKRKEAAAAEDQDDKMNWAAAGLRRPD